MPEVRHAEPPASPVVDQHNVQFAASSRTAEVGRVLGEGRPYRTSRQQAQKYSHVFHTRNKLLNADARNVQGWYGRSNVGVLFHLYRQRTFPSPRLRNWRQSFPLLQREILGAHCCAWPPLENADHHFADQYRWFWRIVEPHPGASCEWTETQCGWVVVRRAAGSARPDPIRSPE